MIVPPNCTCFVPWERMDLGEGVLEPILKGIKWMGIIVIVVQ